MTLVLRSRAFQAQAAIPTVHTCDGADRSPPLEWSGAPEDTRSFALIADDPDAPRGTWVHWVLYDLPAETASLDEAMATSRTLRNGGVQGHNDFRKLGYGGPCPPAGNAHRYFFKLYALDKRLGLAPGATKAEVERAMEGHVLAHAELVGRYERAGR